MKTVLIICAGLLFLALAELPIGYYTLLRIVVTVCAVVVVVKDYNDSMNFWIVAFGLLAIVFNPIFPIYLHDRSAWMPIDIAASVLCLTKAIFWKRQPRT